MLKKMPKVGDVLIANEKAEKEFRYVTNGMEYTVTLIDSDGDAIFEADDGSRLFITDEYYECFSLKADAEPIGFVGMDPDSAIAGDTYVIEVFVDDEGYKAVEALAKQSYKQRNRTEVQARIDTLQAKIIELQAELNE